MLNSGKDKVDKITVQIFYVKIFGKTTRIYISQLDYSDLRDANRKILSRFTKNVFTDSKNQNQNAGNNVELGACRAVAW